MAVKGLKERALIRRGYYTQEALNRRISLDENALKRRLVEDEESSQLSLFDDMPQEEPKKFVPVVNSDGSFNTKKFRDFILNGSKLYPKCSPEVITNTDEVSNKPCVGKIETENCQTGYGIIGGKYASESRGGVGEWSIINFFDTNTIVKNFIEKIHKESNSNLPLNTWINVNINDLVGDNGKYTSILADKILTKDSGSRFKGNQNEEVVISALERSYPGIVINRFCDGDERDRISGQDLMVTYNNLTKYIQVKPLYGSITIRTEIDGQVFFEIPSYQDIISKYSPKEVQMLAFVDGQNYIIFDYVKNMCEQVPNTKSWGPKSPKFILRFKNDPKLKSASLKMVNINELGKLNPEEKLDVLKERMKYLELLVNDSKLKIKYLNNEINKLEA